jgi:hypothetical protein
MKTRLETEVLTVDFEGEAWAVEAACTAVRGVLPAKAKLTDPDKTPNMAEASGPQNITKRGVKVNDGGGTE